MKKKTICLPPSGPGAAKNLLLAAAKSLLRVLIWGTMMLLALMGSLLLNLWTIALFQLSETYRTRPLPRLATLLAGGWLARLAVSLRICSAESLLRI